MDEAVSRQPLEARVLPLPFRPTFPTPVQIPTVPPRLPPLAFPPGSVNPFVQREPLEVTESPPQPETRTLELSQLDNEIISIIALEVSRLPSVFDCIGCAKGWQQDNERESELCIDDDGGEQVRRHRVGK